jgi:hypothetical protein
MNSAWQHAARVAGLLPGNVRWSFHVTDLADDAVFNVYAPREAWHPLRVLLTLPVPEFRYDAPSGSPLTSFQEFYLDGLVLSLIEPEVQNDDGPDGPDDSDA